MEKQEINLDKTYLLFVLLVFIIIVFRGVFLGLGEDPDSYEIIKNISSIVDGDYARSRTSGFPLYEIVVSFIAYFLGIVWANLFSLLTTVISIFIFHKLTFKENNYKFICVDNIIN